MKYLKHILSTLVLVAFFAFSGFSQCEINVGDVDVNDLKSVEFTATSSSVCGVTYNLVGSTDKKIAFVIIAGDTANNGRGSKVAAFRTSNAAGGEAKGSASVAIVQGRKYRVVPQLLVE